jgi:hypothetical protein
MSLSVFHHHGATSVGGTPMAEASADGPPSQIPHTPEPTWRWGTPPRYEPPPCPTMWISGTTFSSCRTALALNLATGSTSWPKATTATSIVTTTCSGTRAGRLRVISTSRSRTAPKTLGQWQATDRDIKRTALPRSAWASPKFVPDPTSNDYFTQPGSPARDAALNNTGSTYCKVRPDIGFLESCTT